MAYSRLFRTKAGICNREFSYSKARDLSSAEAVMKIRRGDSVHLLFFVTNGVTSRLRSGSVRRPLAQSDFLTDTFSVVHIYRLYLPLQGHVIAFDESYFFKKEGEPR